VVWCRQLLQCDGPLLVFDDLRAPFSHVNDGLPDMFPSSRGLSASYRTAIHDPVEALPDACPTKDRFRCREAVSWQGRLFGDCGSRISWKHPAAATRYSGPVSLRNAMSVHAGGLLRCSDRRCLQGGA
jgi:hypothetical protein